MAADIHKKLVYGALGCGGLFVVLAGIGLLIERSGVMPATNEAQVFTPDQSAEAWDSLTGAAPGLLAEQPEFPARLGPTPAPGVLVISPSRAGDYFPPLGDTFPAGSKQRSEWKRVAAQVTVVPSVSPAASRLQGQAPSAATVMFLRARTLLAAADQWAGEDRLGDAGLALDSALAIARAYVGSDDLVRLMVGARIERDAAELVSRDTALAGGTKDVRSAAALVAPLEAFVERVRTIDRWLLAVGASTVYVDSLAGWVGDSGRSLTLRTAAVRAIGLGWAFNPLEPATGIAPVREQALSRLRASTVPDSVAAAIDRVALYGAGLTARMRISATYRTERVLLALP